VLACQGAAEPEQPQQEPFSSDHPSPEDPPPAAAEPAADAGEGGDDDGEDGQEEAAGDVLDALAAEPESLPKI